MNIHRLRQGLALSLLSLLAACGTAAPPPAAAPDSGYLLTVRLEAADTQEAVAQRYGGEVIAWMGDKAILKLSDGAVAQLQTRGVSMQGTTLDPNVSVGAPEVTASGWNAWGSGWNAWGSGWNAWGSGWNAWGSGSNTLPVLPSENRHAWNRISLPEAFALSRNFGAGIKVAVIDTGLDLAHPVFTGRLAPSTDWKDYVDGDAYPQDVAGGSGYGHGTAVAGLILQVAPRATILPIRVLKSDGVGDVANVASAITWAVQRGARIVNLSLGTNVNVSALKTAVDYATAQGVYVVAAAGNAGNTTTLDFPAQYATTGTNAKYMVSVGSTSAESLLSNFTNKGTALEVAAPGEYMYSAYPGGQIVSVQGTSFAAPIVSGMLALGAGETNAANFGNLETYLVGGSWVISNGSRHVNARNLRLQQPDVQRRKALFVVGSTTLGSGDSAVNNRLWTMGYTVTLRTGPASSAADATGMDLVVISSTVNPTDVGTKFRSVAVPLITWEAQLFDDLGMVSTAAGSLGAATGQTSINLINSGHPLGAGIAQGTQSSLSTGVSFSWGLPSSSAIRIATLASDSTRPVIFAYNQGASMPGLTAPARRVAFMFQDTSSTLVDTSWWGGWLFQAAVTWAVTGN